MEIIIVEIFTIAAILCGIVGLLLFIRHIVFYTISKYYTNKNSNILQWKAVEDLDSKIKRMQIQYSEVKFYVFTLYYRIYPPSLPLLVRIFGYNDWKKFTLPFSPLFKDEDEFNKFVSKFSTYGDLKKYLNETENRITYYKPTN